MSDSDLTEILAVLRPEERPRLLSFLESATGVREGALELALYIFECLDANDRSALNRAVAYARLFPEKEPVKNKLENLMSDVLRLSRQFIAREMAQRDQGELRQLLHLQRFYAERGLEKKFRQARQQMLQIKNKHDRWTPQDYYSCFLSEEEESMFQSARNQKKDDLNLWNTIQALDEYYLVERLRYICVLLNQNQLAPLALRPFQEWLLFDLQSPHLRWFFEKPLGRLFLQTIDLLSSEVSDNRQKWQDFIDFLAANENQLDKEYVSTFEIFACNFGIRQINKGNSAFMELVFQIQKRRVESARIYVNEHIKASEFHSIVVIGLRLGEKAWVKKFIESHREKILGVMPSADYYQFNLVFYFFQTKEYEPEISTLLTSNYTDAHYKFSSKLLEVKILYELSLQPNADSRVAEFLENKVEAAIVFFFREKNLPPDKKKLGKHFADTMKRILHASSKGDIKRLEKIREDVVKADLIAERQWLLKIIDDLLEKLGKGG